MNLRILYILFALCIAAGAQDYGLRLTAAEDEIRFINRGDVRWFELELENTLDTTFKDVQVEIHYSNSVRTLRDRTWRGRQGVSPRQHATLVPDNRVIIFELPSIGAGQKMKISAAFVSLSKGSHSFEYRLFIRDEHGELAYAHEALERILSREEEAIEDEPPPEIDSLGLIVSDEEILTEIDSADVLVEGEEEQVIAEHYPSWDLLNKYYKTLIMSLAGNLFLIVVVFALIIYLIIRTLRSKRRKKASAESTIEIPLIIAQPDLSPTHRLEDIPELDILEPDTSEEPLAPSEPEPRDPEPPEEPVAPPELETADVPSATPEHREIATPELDFLSEKHARLAELIAENDRLRRELEK
ncbi:MAG TPA: hypothetical protein ENN07_07525 [candidate division Zixibacteria bacterium]|nr:hypothetical protein [candidate division Zixibacteria bacterium]